MKHFVKMKIFKKELGPPKAVLKWLRQPPIPLMVNTLGSSLTPRGCVPNFIQTVTIQKLCSIQYSTASIDLKCLKVKAVIRYLHIWWIEFFEIYLQNVSINVLVNGKRMTWFILTLSGVIWLVMSALLDSSLQKGTFTWEKLAIIVKEDRSVSTYILLQKICEGVFFFAFKFWKAKAKEMRKKFK